MTTFTTNPSLIPMYARAFAAMGKPKTTESIPLLEANMETQIDPALLGRYNSVCGFKKANFVPVTFPYAMGGSLQLWLWTRPEFPVRIIGGVHVKNQIESFRELVPGEKVELKVRTGECRQVRLGTEHDVITELVDASGKVVWVSTSTNMAPGKPRYKKEATQYTEPAFRETAEFPVPKGIGLEYGKVCRDLNPIHVHPIGAKLFGFPTPIAHGMWAIARSLPYLEREGSRTSSLVVRFRKPIPIGKAVRLHYLKEGNTTHYALKNLKGDVTHLEGNLEFATK